MTISKISNPFTTIRITRSLKNKLDKISSKNDSYATILEKIIDNSYFTKNIESSIVKELQKNRYVDFEDINW